MIRYGLAASALALILTAPLAAQDRSGGPRHSERQHAATAAAAPTTPPPPESHCTYIVRDATGHSAPAEDPNLHVLDQTAADGQWAPTPPTGARGVQCWRNTIVPGPHDQEVILAHLALIITDASGAPPHRVGALDFDGTAFHYTMRTGTMTDAEQAQVNTRLAEFLALIHPSTAAHH